VNVKPFADVPALSASAARYSPAGHPSVCRTSASASLSVTSTAAPATRRRASLGVIASSSTPISSILPWIRSREIGIGTASREPNASRQPLGRRNANSASAAQHSWFRIASTWSSITTTGLSTSANADTSSGTTARSPPARASSSEAAPFTGASRCSAAMIAVHNVAGSLSESSQETQATRGARRCAHWAIKVVLPYPGGATIATTDALLASRASTSADRPTIPSRGSGAVTRWSAPSIAAVVDWEAGRDLGEPESAFSGTHSTLRSGAAARQDHWSVISRLLEVTVGSAESAL
jgi:hypothetical protein